MVAGGGGLLSNATFLDIQLLDNKAFTVHLACSCDIIITYNLLSIFTFLLALFIFTPKIHLTTLLWLLTSGRENGTCGPLLIIIQCYFMNWVAKGVRKKQHLTVSFPFSTGTESPEEAVNRKISIKKDRLPFCRMAVKCSPSSCFSTVAISGFL